MLYSTVIAYLVFYVNLHKILRKIPIPKRLEVARSKTIKKKAINMNRRKFVIGSGAAITAAASTAIGGQLFSRETQNNILEKESTKNNYLPAKYKLSFNPKLCIGCRKCMLACSLHKEGVAGPSVARLRLNLKALAVYNDMEVCRQCDYPACLMSCPFDAYIIDPITGARIVDESLCQNCGTCSKACLFGMIHNYRGKACKCDFCGGDPVCEKACPEGALTYQRIEEA
jgi:carbon-monoxide dehydrogenase iron sulfur subunit